MTSANCSTLEDFAAMASNEDRQRYLESVQQESTLDNVGRKVVYGGFEWVIFGINYLGDYDIERIDARGKVCSSCILGLPAWHPHFAELVSAPMTESNEETK